MGYLCQLRKHLADYVMSEDISQVCLPSPTSRQVSSIRVAAGPQNADRSTFPVSCYTDCSILTSCQKTQQQQRIPFLTSQLI